MTGKQIAKWSLIAMVAIGVLTLLSMWVIPAVNKAVKNQKMDRVSIGEKGQVAQASDNAKVIQAYTEKGGINFYEGVTIVQPDAEKVRALEKKVEDLTSYKGAFPNRPNLIVPSPKVDLIFYTEKTVPSGLSKGRFEILFLNIGGVDAKNVKTKWTIYDHDRQIMGLQEWFALVGQPPMVIDNIPSGAAKGLTYIPDMTTYGQGKIRLIIDYTYTNASTGEEYSDQYNGFVLYENPRDDKAREFIFSKAIE